MHIVGDVLPLALSDVAVTSPHGRGHGGPCECMGSLLTVTEGQWDGPDLPD